MSELPERLVVPDELAARVRAVAARQEMSPEDALAWLLALVLDAVEQSPRRSGRWFLGCLETDDGPTPPTGLGKIIDDHPRWSPVRLALRKNEPKRTAIDVPDVPGEEAGSQASEPTSSCDLCLLRRDDGATALVEVLTRTGEVVVYVERGDRQENTVLELACHEAWLDLGARVWSRVMQTADQVADRLSAPDDAEADPTA